jgi:hypothetical protein
MNIRSFACAAIVVAAACFGCTPTPPETTPAPAATSAPEAPVAHKLGVAVNSASDVGQFAAEAVPIVDWYKAAVDGAANTATAETVVGVMGQGPKNISLAGCYFTPAAAVTANDTSYATLTLAKRTAGGSPTTIATATTQTTVGGGTGSWTQWAPILIPASTGAFLAPGDAVTLAIAKASSGVAVPQGTLSCFTKLE